MQEINEGISLCMIVKNEEKHLETCLNSIKGLVNEIIIVDTGSSDKTKDIALKFTDKVYDYIWDEDFSSARNLGLKKANYSHVLILDADESISRLDFKKLRDLIKEDAEGFVLLCRTYTNDTGIAGLISTKDDRYEESKIASGYYLSKLLRFFKKDYYFEGKIHETVFNSILKNKGKILESGVVIHHHGALDKKRLENKKEIYISLLKKRMENKDFKEKTEDRICFELSRELLALERFDEAIIFLKKAIELKEDFEYYLALGGVYLIKKDLNESERLLKKAVLLNPENSSIHDNLGVLYSQKGDIIKL
ncbi:MAG: glycosyltransferase [Nanoarchaeota archaeon]|nr:glycosyltransferase [Nanoarchaeota archaeon]